MNHALQTVISSPALVPILLALSLAASARKVVAAPVPQVCAQAPEGADFLRTAGQGGICGGRLVVSQRSEPKTFNPLIAADANSRRIINLLNADLLHINRTDFVVEPALAKSWTLSPDGREYTLVLRRGLRFSDGSPFSADDVVFSFQAYLDEKVDSPERDLLLISGVPLKVRKIDDYKVRFTLPCRYAAGERLFDGIAILPRHILANKVRSGDLGSAWGVSTDPKQVVGLGPFRLKAFAPGQRVVLERNPFYWKADAAGQRLPYFDELVSEVVPNSEAESMRFLSGETDMVSRLTAANLAALESNEQKRRFHLYDLGPGFEYTFLFFNLNAIDAPSSSPLTQQQKWFEQVEFRQAVAEAVDRNAIVRLAYRGHAVPISVPISSANSFWRNGSIPAPVRSIPRAREKLRKAGFSWDLNGDLVDTEGKRVSFSLLVNAANPQQQEIGVIIQQDLKDLGIGVTLNLLEYRSFLNRILSSFDYDAAVATLADGDADPNTELSVLDSHGGNHLWSLKPKRIPPWQAEIDGLMQRQLIAGSAAERKRLFDHVQEILCKYKPAVFLISPNILVAAKDEIRNFHPAKLADYTLWNADQLFRSPERRTNAR
jgi:peptide/nickel transport system substrate-binding protein